MSTNLNNKGWELPLSWQCPELSEEERMEPFDRRALSLAAWERDQQPDAPAPLWEQVQRGTREQVMYRTLRAHPERAFYFLNEAALQGQARRLAAHFLPDRDYAHLAYAMKANPHTRVLTLLGDAGIHVLDCSSVGEVEVARATVPQSKLMFNHPTRFDEEYRSAAQQGVQHFTVESREDAERVLEALHLASNADEKDLELVMRVQTLNPGAAINLSEKFGASPEEARDTLLWLKRTTNLRVGLAMNVGSQNTDPRAYESALKQLGNLAHDVGGVEVINMGGGLPVNLRPEDDYDQTEFLDRISHTFRTIENHALAPDPFVVIEPGRAVVAESIDLVIPVVSIRTHAGAPPRVHMDDGVFTSFSDYVLHDWEYPLQPLRVSGTTFSTPSRPYHLWGRTCDSGDELGVRELPHDFNRNDYLWVLHAGAYMSAQATKFNNYLPHSYIPYHP